VDHKEADRLPLFRPNIIQTYEPFDERAQHFMDTFLQSFPSASLGNDCHGSFVNHRC